MKQSRIRTFVVMTCLLAGCGSPDISGTLTTNPVDKKTGSSQVSLSPTNGNSQANQAGSNGSTQQGLSAVDGFEDNDLVNNVDQEFDFDNTGNNNNNNNNNNASPSPTVKPSKSPKASPTPSDNPAASPTASPSPSASPMKQCVCKVNGGGSFYLSGNADKDVSLSFNATDRGMDAQGMMDVEGDLSVLIKNFDKDAEKVFKSAKITSVDCKQFGSVTIQGKLQGGAAFTLIVIFTPGIGKVSQIIFIANGEKVFDEKMEPDHGNGSVIVSVERTDCDH